MSTINKPSIAVLGASGDTAGWALASALLNGHSCRTLARNPDKLVNLMLGRGVSQKILDHSLVIVKGNAKNKDDVKSVLQAADGKTVDRILFGVGGKPSFAFTWSLFTIDDPQVCEHSMAALLAALSELARERPTSTFPQVTAISTTGITSGPRDVPWLLAPLYHWLLVTPHIDKRRMEGLLRGAAAQDSKFSGLSAATLVRPTLLVDGKGVGASALRSGREAHPALGYSIARKDVGLWMYENLLSGNATTWTGEAITLTS